MFVRTGHRESMRNRLVILFAFVLSYCLPTIAQVGEYRNDFSVGVNGGYVLSDVGFTPTVSQDFHGGITGGISFRYVCEKYFSTICSVYGEINYAQLGWKEDILDRQDQPVINKKTGLEEEYSRTANYIQIPIFARLGWGRERKGAQFFFQVGPQFGFFLNESTKTNFNFPERNQEDRINKTCAQDTLSIQNHFDYGISAGLGLEYSVPKVGHFLLEGRYYYGLGNIYKDSKRDYFSKSNYGNIVIKLTYLFDIIKTKNL